jgi:hypothetical protein
MACAACAKKKPNSYQDMKAIESPPFRATDIVVYDIETNESHRFNKEDYDTSKDNILLFVQTVNDIKEVGESGFDGTNVTYVTNQPIHQIQDYYNNGGAKPKNGKIFSSYLLPSRTGLIYNGTSRKAIVFVMKDGDFVVQQLFYNSSFNYDSIRVFLEDYANDSN